DLAALLGRQVLDLLLQLLVPLGSEDDFLHFGLLTPCERKAAAHEGAVAGADSSHGQPVASSGASTTISRSYAGRSTDAVVGRAGMVEGAGAGIVAVNFGGRVKKVTRTGAGATLLEDPARATAIVSAVAGAVDIPVSVKMRRGLENGSRACLDVGPRLVEAGAATLTLHPRSARQMYTGEADHALTAELVERVGVPVVASGDVTSRARAQAVLATTGAAA